MPKLARIVIYPVKSLDGQDVSAATILPSGAIENDRRFAIVDEDGFVVHGKRTPAVHTIRSFWDPGSNTLTLGVAGASEQTRFDLSGDLGDVHSWLSAHFKLPVRLIENREGGFPDDTRAPGPTLIGRATLEEVARWFPGLSTDETRRRFRANLEIDAVDPFWEDHLFREAGATVRFRVGTMVFEGANPCARCVVPSRSPHRGDSIPGFTRRFIKNRQATLPAWAEASRFEHFYRLSVNTRGAQGAGGMIGVGDTVELLDD